MHRGKRPPSDDAYYENLTRCVFQSGLGWATIAQKWPAFQKAFEAFQIRRVASYGAADLSRLMADPGIIRNNRKIVASIHNARESERIQQEHGGFPQWLDSLDKANNYAGVVKRVTQRFKHVGPTAAPLWLYSVNEQIDMTSLVEARWGKNVPE
jgi:DNA-3-methyladenine glycosylase I